MFQPEFPNRRFCEDSIFNATAGITGKLAGPRRVKGIHRFDEPDGPDGDQIILRRRGRIVFFGHMGYQPQIVANQAIPRLGGCLAACTQCCKGFFFPRRRKRPRKGTAFEMQHQIQYMPGRCLQKQAQNLKHTPTPCPSVCRGYRAYAPK